MKAAINESVSFSSSDQAKLTKLVSILESASEPTIIFAVVPDSGLQHPIVQELRSLLGASDVDFQLQNFFYSDRPLPNFLDSLDKTEQRASQIRRKIVMAFGIEQLPLLCLVRQMKQLNLSREMLFGRELLLIFWLNKAEFMGEFRHRAPALWHLRPRVVKFQTSSNLNPLLYPYLEWLIAENSYLKIGAMQQPTKSSPHPYLDVAPPSPSVDILLERIYISRQAERQQLTDLEQGQRELEVFTQQSKGQKSQVLHFCRYGKSPRDFVVSPTNAKIDLSQVVRENQYSLILGAPGAGKTTLLRYLALHFATAKRDAQETVFCGCGQEELGNPLLPIFFCIAEYAEQLNRQPDLSLWDYLHQFYGYWEALFKNEVETEAGTEITALLLEKIRQGQCLMLLDGLDEVHDQHSRSLIVERINQFVDAYSANKFVMTSRMTESQDVKLGDRFSRFAIKDLGSKQVEEFLHRWCRAIAEAQQPEASKEQWQKVGDAQARETLALIETNKDVKHLAANPLLLTILALTYRNSSYLPNRRVKLYELAVQHFTEVSQLLAPLAYWMHEQKPSGLVTHEELNQVLGQHLARVIPLLPSVEQFLRQVGETTGLFGERAFGVYGFMHQTFEEYFAARFIADNDQSEILRLMHSHLHKPRWDEPILLALGHYSSHSPAQVNQLVEQLFSYLETYEPIISRDKLTINHPSATEAILVWSSGQDESAITCNQFELPLKDLLFAGRVLTEVEVNSNIRKKLIQKLVSTYLCLDADFKDEAIKQLLRLLRQVELFTRQGEVITQLKRAASDLNLSELIYTKAQLAILYVACGEPGAGLVDCVNDIINQLNSSLFVGIKELVTVLGPEITPALESIQREYHTDTSDQLLNFAIALSSIRTNHYENAVTLLKELIDQPHDNSSPFISWALAICHQEMHEYAQALVYYRQAFEKLNVSPEKTAFLAFWRDWSVCCRLQAKHEQSLEDFPQGLTLCQKVNQSEEFQEFYQFEDWGEYELAIEFQQQCLTLYQNPESQLLGAVNHYQLGRTYQAGGKYEQAAEHYQHSGDLYLHLGRDKSAADVYYQLSRIYQIWGKYEQAVECQQQCLTLRQKLKDQAVVALSYYQLGHIHQSWGKYDQAIHSYHNSCILYQQLGQDKNVADAYYKIGRIYQDWGNYQQAVEYQQQCLILHQNLGNQVLVALDYYQLGRIYQDWGQYEQAIEYYQHSCGLYQQLDRDKDVADQWHWLANCYQAWGKYEQAVKYYQLSHELYQQLGLNREVAHAYHQLGCIYQASGQYDQAIDYYQYSYELYRQLGLNEEVVIQLCWLTICYQMRSKYEQALDCQQQCLMLNHNPENQVLMSLNHYLAKLHLSIVE